MIPHCHAQFISAKFKNAKFISQKMCSFMFRISEWSLKRKLPRRSHSWDVKIENAFWEDNEKFNDNKLACFARDLICDTLNGNTLAYLINHKKCGSYNDDKLASFARNLIYCTLNGNMLAYFINRKKCCSFSDNKWPRVRLSLVWFKFYIWCHLWISWGVNYTVISFEAVLSCQLYWDVIWGCPEV